MTARDLRAMLEAMPPGSLVPAAWLVERLADLADAPAAPDDAVLDVAALARRWKRSRTAARALLETGAIPGAWKHGGKAWRVRREDVEAYEAAQAAPSPPHATSGALRAIARGERPA